MSKHTPGPWFDHGFHEDGIDGERVVAQRRHESMGYAVACVLPCGEPDTRPMVTEANARLIAAAPELLSSLQAALTVLNDSVGDFDYEAAVAAIAKATGAQP